MAAHDGAVAGMLLTGGASRRMGTEKARLLVNGRGLANRLAGLLAEVASPAIEVGLGVTRLPSLREVPPGGGPLSAVAAGWEALCALGAPRATLVLACDLPLLTVEVLRMLANWPGESSVVPVVGGRAQPLCARWSCAAMAASRGRLAHDRSLAHLAAGSDTVFIDETVWGSLVEPQAFEDVDRPEDLERLGLTWFPGPSGTVSEQVQWTE